MLNRLKYCLLCTVCLPILLIAWLFIGIMFIITPLIALIDPDRFEIALSRELKNE